MSRSVAGSSSRRDKEPRHDGTHAEARSPLASWRGLLDNEYAPARGKKEDTVLSRFRRECVTVSRLASGRVLARTITHALVGLDARRVEVEAHLQGGVPAFTIVGLADRACQEAKERVRSGIISAELEWPGGRKRITVNLAPAALRKEGSGFDLPIALAVAAAT